MYQNNRSPFRKMFGMKRSNHQQPTFAAISRSCNSTGEPNVHMEDSPSPPILDRHTPPLTDEELSKYFSTANHIQIVFSPISNHLEQVRAVLTGDEFPTDKAQVATLRASLLKLAISADIPQPKRDVFYSIALQINNLFYKYRISKESFDDASLDLKRLGQLQEKKSQFHASYLALETERKSILTRQKEIEDRTAALNTQLEAIRQEMANLKTESTQLATQLATFSDQRLNLYAEATSLDHDIVPLLSQKVGLEIDLKIGSEGLAEFNKTWDCLRQMLVQATNAEALVESDPAVVGGTLDAEKTKSARPITA